MTVDPKLCRKIASEVQADVDNDPNAGEYRMTWGAASAIADQLTAAADLADKYERDTAALHRDLCAERNAMRSHLTERPTLTEELAGRALWFGPEKAAIVLQALEYWNRDLSAPHAQIAEIRRLLEGDQ